MSSAPYRDPYRLPAGLLAITVHGAFFLLLYLGFNWQSAQPQAMSVELWQRLPDALPSAMEATPTEAAQPVKPVRLEEPMKPDIAMPKNRQDAKKPVSKQPEAKPEKAKPVAAKKAESKQSEEDRRIDEQAAREQEEFEKSERELTLREQEEAQRAKREQANAIGVVVTEFTGKIKGKIQRGLVMPPNVNKNAQAEVLVTLLPGGRVLKVVFKKSSGNALYDEAVERAILKSSPLPLPPDAELFERFRELKLVFKPAD